MGPVDLQPPQAGVQESWQQFAKALGGRMRPDGDPTRLADRARDLLRGRDLGWKVRRAVVSDEARKGIPDVGRVASVDQRTGEVRTRVGHGGRAALGVELLARNRDAEFPEPPRHLQHACVAALVATAGVAREHLGLRIDEVAQDVDIPAREGAAHLHRRNDLERSPAGSCYGWPHALDGVVVGERQHIQLAGNRTLYDALGRDSAVRGRRVHVQI